MSVIKTFRTGADCSGREDLAHLMFHTSVPIPKFLCTLILDGDGAGAEALDGGEDVVG